MATTLFAPSGVAPSKLWRVPQVAGLLLTVVLVIALWRFPDTALQVLWYGAIPLLPAAFLVSPLLWRNMCPLATLNTLPGKWSRGLRLEGKTAHVAMLIGFALLLLLVPARRFLFNNNGPALALVIIAVALLAFALGFVFDRKAGFCNSICPVLPVEKLYGQDPMMHVQNAHCASCTLCTARGCLDLAPRKAVGQTMHLRGSNKDVWFLSPYGAFAASFPGFVVAYYLSTDTTLANAGTVYLTVILSMAFSFACVASLSVLLRPSPRTALTMIGATSLFLYYWFAARSIADQWLFGSAGTVAVRLLAVALVGYWVMRGLKVRAPELTA